ncbi:uncharacterized protein LOC123320194 [Coccinella septempunctata]|uniref:uncharacterized protein LOC123320194 n=1 Tax=Coccinella septempunctata TaxID=41139 RepID=UPI001D0626F3|nr:uncharacterized protein LOC123320194 [Coccinella septempunctata]XP_044763342.1 uncharacterized protein LOC123320194 [Coccinella septempunctata]
MHRYSLGRPLQFQSTTPPSPSPPPPPPSPSTALPLPSPPSRESSPGMSLWTDFECPRPLTTDAGTNTVRPATRTVSTNGIQVFLELRTRSCWKCGGEGHTRERCQGSRVKFCSGCGLMGVLSRDCCVRAPNRVLETPLRPGRASGVSSATPVSSSTAEGIAPTATPSETDQAAHRSSTDHRLSTDHRSCPPLRNRKEAWLPDLRLRPAAPAAPTPSLSLRKKVKVD